MDRLSKLVLATLIVATIVLYFTTAKGEMVLIDVFGRYVVLRDVPRRVVVLAPSLTEILAYLGVEDSIVGADTFSLNSWYMGVGSRLQARNVTSVGGYWWTAISVEKIVELQPDLVLADVGAHRPLLETFEANNVTVFYLHGGSARTVYDVYSDIHALGVMFNKLDRATELVKAIEEEIERKRAVFEISGYKGLRVLIVIDFWGGIWVAGKATYIDDVVSRLGLVNAAGIYGWGLASVERVTEWNPDVIIVACGYATEETVRESGLYELGKPIVILNSTEVDTLSRPGPLLLYAPSVLYEAISRVVKPETSPVSVETPVTPTPTKVVETTPERQETIPIETPAVAREERGWNLQLVVAVIVAVVVGGLIGYVIGYKVRK